MEADLEKQIIEATAEPDIKFLADEYQTTVSDLGTWIQQQETNYKTRHCIWSGQHTDGRKHGDINNPAFPWEGASDLRTFIVDQLISADVAVLTTSLFRANVQAVPTETNDMERSRIVSSFMRWLIFSQIDELEREADILANYYLEKGVGALGIFWETKVSKSLRTITLEEVASVASDLVPYFQNKDYEGDLADVVQQFFPEVSRKKARAMIRELRATGQTTISQTDTVYNRPVIRAYSFDKDLFIPMDTTDIQQAPYIFKEEWFTPEALRNKVITEGWSEEWVEDIIESMQGKDFNEEKTLSAWDTRYSAEEDGREGRIKTACAYYRAVDEDGIPGVYYAVFHPNKPLDITGKSYYAIHGLLDYKPARYPFVVFARESLSRRILETRGYPEILKGFQDQIKIERDSRIDRTSLATCPPMEYPAGRKVDRWGPGVKVPVRRRGEYGFAEIPKFDSGSIEVEQNLLATARKYVGRATNELDVVEANVLQQNLVRRWFGFWKQAMQQVWSLYRQYGEDEELFRVVGADNSDPQLMVKGEDNEKYDFYIDFDVNTFNREQKIQETEAIAKLLAQYDRYGMTDWTVLIKKLVGAYDPVLAQQVILPQQQAQNRELEEEKKVLTEIWSGMDVDIAPTVNAPFRMQVVQNYINGTETIPAQDVQKRLQEDESFKARLTKHMQQLQFIMTQQQNAVTGRLGTAPGNMSQPYGQG